MIKAKLRRSRATLGDADMIKLLRSVFFTILAIIAAAGVAVLTIMAITVGMAFAPFRAWKHRGNRGSAAGEIWTAANGAVAAR